MPVPASVVPDVNVGQQTRVGRVRSWCSFRIPIRFLRGNYGRFGLTMIALACGVALVCALDIVSTAVLNGFMEIIDTMAGRASLQVSAGEGGLFSEDVAATVANVQGVELAVPAVTGAAFIDDDSGELLTVYGIDVANDSAVRVYEGVDGEGEPVEDPLVFLSRPDSILVTRVFASRRGLGVGSSLVLETPVGRRSFTVRGLLDPKGVARVYGGNIAVMDLYAAEAVFARPRLVNRVDIVVERETGVEQVRQAIVQILPEGLKVDSPGQRKADLQKVMASMRLMLRAVSVVGLLAAFLIAFNRVTNVFEARLWQLGVLCAVGVRRMTAWRELVKESLILGMGGVVLGVPFGIALGQILLPVIATTAALNYKMVAPAATLVVDPKALLLAAALGLGTALVAAALPAWRAANRAVAEAIRRRGVEESDLGLGARRGIRIAVAAGIVLALSGQLISNSPMWGLVGTAFVAVGTAFAARPLLELIRAPLVSTMSLMTGATGRFAGALMFKQPRRAALTTAMLGVGLGSMFWLWTVAHSFQTSVIKALGSAFSADLIVTSSRIASGFDGAPIDGKLAPRIRRLAGVSDAIGERIVDWHYAGGPIAIDAFDPTYFSTRRFGRWILSGARIPNVWNEVSAGRAVIVSTSFVRNIGAGVGDTIELETPRGHLSVLIGGVTTAFASPRGTVEISRQLYTKYWRDGQITRVHVAAEHGFDRRRLETDIAQRFGRRFRLHILSSAELLEYWAVQVRRAFSFLYILGLLVLFVILLGMADTLAAGVADRVRDLGVMRAVGVRRQHVRLMVVLEAASLGTAGLILGGIAGICLGALWVKVTFPQLLGWSLELHLPYSEGMLVAALTIAVCVLAAMLPAIQASRLEPGIALRYE